MAKKSTPFRSALSFPNRTFAYLCSQVEQQKHVLYKVHEVLPTAIAQHALHCVVHGKKLLVYTDNAAWASQLRFYNSAILAAIAPVTREPVSIMQVKIKTGAIQTKPPSRKPNIPSAERIERLYHDSLTITDEPLKQALLRLSNTLKKLSDTS
ncbi:MAG: DciA family protein [Methylobacter sp.]